MIPNGLLTQIAIIILSVGIIVTYVKPTMDVIDGHQDQIATYQVERDSVREVNGKLASLVSRVNSIDADSQLRLLTYLPDEVDTIAVPRTIEAIAIQSGVVLDKVAHETADENNTQAVSADPQYVEEGPSTAVPPDFEEFGVSIQGSYEQMKTFLRLLEQNEFPLEVTGIEVTQSELGILSVQLTIKTYSHHEIAAGSNTPTNNEQL